MGRIPMNAMKKEDVKKTGDKGNNPMPAPNKKGEPKDYQDKKGNVSKNGSGWF